MKDYELGHFIRFWDTPGLGDGVEQDKQNIALINGLIDMDYLSNGDEYKRTSFIPYPYSQHLIDQGFGSLAKHLDFVLVIVEGSNKDMGMTYKLLNEVLMPKIQADNILVAINQAYRTNANFKTPPFKFTVVDLNSPTMYFILVQVVM